MAPQQSIAVVWFRTGDLRITDHEPLLQATQSASRIVPMYNLDDRDLRSPAHDELPSPSDTTLELPATGPHRLLALLRAVHSLKESLNRLGSDLLYSAGITPEVISSLVTAVAQERPGTISLHYYERLPKELGSIQGSVIHRDEEETNVVQIFLESAAEYGMAAQVHAVSSGHSLFKVEDIDPDTLDLLRKGGTMTDVRRRLHTTTAVRLPYGAPPAVPPLPECCLGVEFGRALTLPPASTADTANTVDSTIRAMYHNAGATNALENLEKLVGHINLETLPPPAPGVPPPAATEPEAAARLYHLLTSPAFTSSYRESRMAAGSVDGSAMLSVALSLGSISPRTVYCECLNAMLKLEYQLEENAAAAAAGAGECGGAEGAARDWKWTDPTVSSPGHHWLLMHLGIRDFFLLYDSYNASNQEERSTMAASEKEEKGWLRGDPQNELFTAWARGKTGFPFIDANMRQLAATGYMSNRGRQNVASFLAKALNIDWRLGAELFRALLIDHDPAVNQSSWAYVAGFGADPRQSREFKTVTQGERYDPHADFITAWVPELRDLPVELRHRPWEQQKKGGEESKSGTSEGVVYPPPIIEPDGQIGKGPKKKNR